METSSPSGGETVGGGAVHPTTSSEAMTATAQRDRRLRMIGMFPRAWKILSDGLPPGVTVHYRKSLAARTAIPGPGHCYLSVVASSRGRGALDPRVADNGPRRMCEAVARLRHALRGLVVGVIVPVVMAAGAVMMPGTASAETCATYTHRYFLGAGSAVTLRVAYVDAALKVCRDDTGVSGAFASQTVGTTGPGNAAGFSIDAGPAIVNYMGSPVVLASYKGSIRTCVVQRTPLCSSAEEYMITVRIGTPTIGDPNAPDWYHAPESPGGVHYYEDA